MEEDFSAIIVWHTVEASDHTPVRDNQWHAHFNVEHLASMIVSKLRHGQTTVDFGAYIHGVFPELIDLSLCDA